MIQKRSINFITRQKKAIRTWVSDHLTHELNIICNVLLLELLTHFMPLVSFYTSWKHQKTLRYRKRPGIWKGESPFQILERDRGYRKRPGDIERDQWHEMG